MCKNSPGFAQGVSDHELVQLLQQLFQHLLSISALVFNRHFATIPQFSQLFYTKFEPKSLFSAKISNSASTAARTTVSCLYSAHARAPLQGPGGIGIGSCLSLVGHFFWSSFWNVFFHNKIVFLQKMTPKLLQNPLQIWPWISFPGFWAHLVFERQYHVFAIFSCVRPLETVPKTL